MKLPLVDLFFVIGNSNKWKPSFSSNRIKKKEKSGSNTGNKTEWNFYFHSVLIKENCGLRTMKNWLTMPKLPLISSTNIHGVLTKLWESIIEQIGIFRAIKNIPEKKWQCSFGIVSQ